ncbi:hypothetical protein Tco_0597412 [Tanacetum coccineum]
MTALNCLEVILRKIDICSFSCLLPIFVVPPSSNLPVAIDLRSVADREHQRTSSFELAEGFQTTIKSGLFDLSKQHKPALESRQTYGQSDTLAGEPSYLPQLRSSECGAERRAA